MFSINIFLFYFFSSCRKTWKESCAKLLDDMLKLDDAACFRGRYKAKTAAHSKFYDFLGQQGMQCEPSLNKIKKKITQGEYVHALQVGQDVRKLINQAISFFSSSDAVSALEKVEKSSNNYLINSQILCVCFRMGWLLIRHYIFSKMNLRKY